MTIQSLLIIALALLDIVCILAVIFVERKNPSSTIAWALVILFLPLGGFLAYAMFGSGFHINQKKRYALKQFSDSLYKRWISGGRQNCAVCDVDMGIPHARMIRYLEKGGEHFYTDNNAARIFTDGQSTFAAMKDDLRLAQKHIHLLYYIFRNDALGREIVSILTEKARQGVEVYVIYDSLGSALSNERMFKELKEAGGKVEAFSPLLSNLSTHLRLNYRNHRKITVVDGLIGYVGGMNIGEEYLGKKKRLSPWRDTHLRLTGTAVAFLQERFLLDWIYINEEEVVSEALPELFPIPVEEGNLGVQIVSGGPDTPSSPIKSGLLEMLYAARHHVYIQTPYFLPDDSFCDALRIAAQSGVDVRLMLPGKSDNFIVHAATLSYARQVMDAGVTLYEYNGFLHAKTMSIDGEVVTIGTANLDNRSFSLNFEINAFIYNSEFAALHEQIFLEDTLNSRKLDESWYTQRNFATRSFSSLCRLLSPLM